METQATGEIESLKACINDLIAIVALPAMWSGSEPDGIAGTLLDALVGMLQLDLAYIQLGGPDRDAPIRMVRAADARAPLGEVDELSARFERTFGRDLHAWPSSGRLSLAGRDLSLSILPLGLQGAVGIIVAGSSRDDFPGPTERLLLNVAANQAVVGVQEARIRQDQRRVAEELDRRVAERTTELAAVNDALRREIAERSLVEERLRHDERELKRSEAFLTEAQRLSATGSFSLNPTTGANWWSEETYRIFGAEPGHPPTLELMRELVHPDDRDVLAHGLACARRGESFAMEFRLVMPDGRLKHLQVVAHTTYVGGADPYEFVGAVRDCTETRISEAALGKARAELAHVARVMSLGALTASIAHEVNQPLSGIVTNASTCLRMLAAEPPNVEGAGETARRIIRDGHRASDVITRLRALFARRTTTWERVDLNDAAREVVALSLAELKRDGVTVVEGLTDDLPAVCGDRVQLQQVIVNLLHNAADAMRGVHDRPRHVVIRTVRDENGDVRLSVQDTGVGLDPKAADRLFDAFYTTKADGMGIGLAVSKFIIESHNGHLAATANEGPGATLAFTLPEAPVSFARRATLPDPAARRCR